MIPGMNPRKMQQMMKQLGMKQEEIPATEVIIRTADKELIIQNPSVQKVNMMGQENFQISGEVVERSLDTTPEISQEDVETVMQQTGKDEATVKQALQDSKGDLAEAIMSLTNDE